MYTVYILWRIHTVETKPIPSLLCWIFNIIIRGRKSYYITSFQHVHDAYPFWNWLRAWQHCLTHGWVISWNFTVKIIFSTCFSVLHRIAWNNFKIITCTHGQVCNSSSELCMHLQAVKKPVWLFILCAYSFLRPLSSYLFISTGQTKSNVGKIV